MFRYPLPPVVVVTYTQYFLHEAADSQTNRQTQHNLLSGDNEDTMVK